MAIRHIITAIKLFLINRKFKTKEVNEGCRKHCLAILQLLQPVAFDNYKPTEWSNKSIELLFPRIDFFTEKLNVINRLMVSGNIIDNNSIPDYRLAVDLDMFFTSKSGYYINHHNEVENFKQAAIELCNLSEVCDASTIGIDAHHRRLLQPIYIDIRNLTLKLLKAN